MSRRRRVFTEIHREAFCAEIGRMREKCLDVCGTAPIHGVDYRAASDLKDRLDDAIEALTGDRERFWVKWHSWPK